MAPARRVAPFSASCLALALGLVAAPASAQNIVPHTESFDLGEPVAPTLRWTMRLAGLCGQKCRNGPRQMYSASVGDTFLMSWMAVKSDVPAEQTGWVQYGNVATFQVSDTGEFTFVDTVGFDGTCEAIYGITAKADGSLISVLCQGQADPESTVGTEPLPGAIDLLATRKSADCDESDIRSCYPIGNFCPTASPLYIFEYEAPAGSAEPARITNEPTRVIRVNHAVGGWQYGHHEFTLNQAEDTYFLALKVVSNGCDHEGLTHFGVRRTPDFEYVQLTDGWACSGGHTEANRLAYNQQGDTWSIFCTNDLCDENQRFVSHRCRGVDVSMVPGTSHQGAADGPSYHEGEELIAMERWDTNWNLPGGGAAILSLGSDGWLALAPAPDPESPYEERLKEARALGVINLPLDGADLAGQRQTATVPTYETRDDPTPSGEAEVYFHDWRWLALPEARDGSRPRYGFANMAYFDTLGEDSARLLLGWSPSTQTQGITTEYVVAEMDRQGRIRGEPMTLEGTGWGEDNRWTTMSGSGCVVFPFAWSGEDGPGDDYPIEGNEPTAYPSVIHLTSLCPNGAQPAVNEALSGAIAPGDTRGSYEPPGGAATGDAGSGDGDASGDGAGCGCSVPGKPVRPPSRWMGLGALGLAWLRRRKISPRSSCR